MKAEGALAKRKQWEQKSGGLGDIIVEGVLDGGTEPWSAAKRL